MTQDTSTFDGNSPPAVFAPFSLLTKEMTAEKRDLSMEKPSRRVRLKLACAVGLPFTSLILLANYLAYSGVKGGRSRFGINPVEISSDRRSATGLSRNAAIVKPRALSVQTGTALALAQSQIYIGGE